MIVTAERICLALKSRGIPTADVAGYKALLRTLNADEQMCVADHLKRVVMGGDDELSREFMSSLRELAMGRCIETDDAILAKLVPYTHSPRIYARQIEQSIPVRQQGMTPDPFSIRTVDEKEVIRKKHYVYGSSCAFMFELDWLKSRSNSGAQKRTVTIEGARQIGYRSYDWQTRISFQLTLLELPQFTGVMLGGLRQGQVWEVGNHGTQRNKFFRAKEQDHSVFMKLEQAQHRWPIKVDQMNRYPILSICFDALKHNDAHLDLSTIQELCKVSLPKQSRP